MPSLCSRTDVEATRARPLRTRLRGVFALAAAALMACTAAGNAAADPVRVATRVERGSAQLELEWQRPVEYAVMRSGAYILMRFSRPLEGQFEAARGALNRYLVDLHVAGEGRVLVMRMSGEPRFVHQQRGNAVVLMWVGNTRAASDGPAESGPPERLPQRAAPRTEAAPSRPAAPRIDPPPGRPATPPERADRPSLPQAETPPVPAAPRHEAAKPPPIPPMPGSDRPEPAKPEIRPAPEARPAPEGSIEPPVMPAISPTLTVSSNRAETRIVLAWPEPVAAAVFRYGEHIWMVFPRRQAFDVEAFQKMLGPGVERLVRIDHAQATILSVRARADVHARVAHERNVWRVVLRRENAAPNGADVKIAITRGSSEQVAVPLAGAEAPIRLIDPEVGSTLFVVPSRALASLGAERAFVTFRIVPSVQGGVIEALADGLTVGAEGGAVTLRRAGGLFLANGTPLGSAGK